MSDAADLALQRARQAMARSASQRVPNDGAPSPRPTATVARIPAGMPAPIAPRSRLTGADSERVAVRERGGRPGGRPPTSVGRGPFSRSAPLAAAAASQEAMAEQIELAQLRAKLAEREALTTGGGQVSPQPTSTSEPEASSNSKQSLRGHVGGKLAVRAPAPEQEAQTLHLPPPANGDATDSLLSQNTDTLPFGPDMIPHREEWEPPPVHRCCWRACSLVLAFCFLVLVLGDSHSVHLLPFSNCPFLLVFLFLSCV